MDFVHLHVHSHLSLLDSTIRILPLAHRIKELGMGAVALTDHGNLFGAVRFASACSETDLKPIFGSEVLVAGDSEDEPAHHLVLLCRTREGFSNLRAIVSRSYLEGLRHGTPTTTMDILADNCNGLTALSGCMGGRVPQAVLRGHLEAAEEAARKFDEVFGHGNFFLELEGNDLTEQETVNSALIEMADTTGIPLVATNNAHYLDPDDAVAHAVLVAIELKRTLNKEQRKGLPLRSFHLATPDEMVKRFHDSPEAIENTIRIADSIEPDVFEARSDQHFPIFETPGGKKTSSFLSELAREGLDNRLENTTDAGNKPLDRSPYNSRLKRELELIIKMGFDAYYLIVWDFIRWAREQGIPVGPGRGSGAGSLVAYAIGVTDIDPIRYGLLFERFLNPERVSPPDFDIDFCKVRREEVINYVGRKYGSEYVGQIITYSQLKAKAVIRDVARVMGLSFAEGDRIAKLIPTHPKMTLDKAIKQEPDLAKLINDTDSDPGYGELWQVALKLEGLSRQPGKHAAGVVIADRPISEYVPLFVTDDGTVVTQFDMKDLDAVGLIKFDFLGLKSLTIIADAVKAIRVKSDPDFRIEDIPLDDPKTYKLLNSGSTAGVFQLESRGITNLVQRVKPDCIEDIIAILALYRPGPLGGGMVDDFIECKHGKKKVTYPIPELKPILEETHGVILYQEQVMRIASRLAGFSLGRADLLRRAMGKKKVMELEAHREPFIEGAVANDVPEKEARKLFEKMEFFAEYGFNKSHSAAYAFLTYRTAFLKAHHPSQFLCANMTAERGNQDKLTFFMHEAGNFGVRILLPDVNESDSDFSVVDFDEPNSQAIRFGLSAVKGIGDKAVEVILKAREDGPFDDFMDFLVRVDPHKINRRVIETLIKSGGLDCFGHTRRSLFEGLDQQMDFAQTRRVEKDSGQMGLFDSQPADSNVSAPVGPPDLPEWGFKERLAFERAAVGYYVSDHPLDPYKTDLKKRKIPLIGDLLEGNVGKTKVRAAGIVIARSEKVSKAGGRMAFITLEDGTGQIECKIFSRVYPEWAAVSDTDDPLLFSGDLRYDVVADNETISILVDSIERLDDARENMVHSFTAHLDLDGLRETTVDKLGEVIKNHPGKCPLVLVMHLKGVGSMHLRTSADWNVAPIDDTIKAVEGILGPGTASLD